jgi:DNA replication protein DnaC
MIHEREELRNRLRDLNLTSIAEEFEAVALRAAAESLSHEAFLAELVRLEHAAKRSRRLDRLRKQSGLLIGKTFESLELSAFSPKIRQQLEPLWSGTFLDDARNVIAVGRPGSGKTHLACALGYRLIEEGVSVTFSSAVALTQRLLAAKRDLRLPQEMLKLDRFACLILDDIGYVQHDREEMEVLFTLLAERYERRSLIITTNLVFSEWDQIFKNPMTTLAAVDRVVHHSTILDLTDTESFRAKAAVAAKAKRIAVTGNGVPASVAVE